MFSKQLVLTEWGLHLGMSVGVPPPTMINALMVHGVDSLQKLSLKCGFHEIRKEMTGSVLVRYGSVFGRGCVEGSGHHRYVRSTRHGASFSPTATAKAKTAEFNK